jgi:hypothetical protein
MEQRSFMSFKGTPFSFIGSVETLSLSSHPAHHPRYTFQYGSEAMHDLPLSLSIPHSST